MEQWNSKKDNIHLWVSSRAMQKVRVEAHGIIRNVRVTVTSLKDSEREPRTSDYVQGIEHKLLGTDYRAQGTGHRAQGTDYRVQSTEHRAQSTKTN